VIINGFALLSQKVRNVYLVLVGDGPLRQQLEEQATKLGLRDRLLFLGYRNDVPELLAMFDAYVNMAYAEGFGIAVIEAMQAGLPVVLANAGALPELIEDGISGLLVPPGDCQSLANALLRLNADRIWARHIGESARRKALRDFSIDRFAQDFECLYRKVAQTDCSRGLSGGRV
jgi:glycosyltransferase involved in cell wall biosynthesis